MWCGVGWGGVGWGGVALGGLVWGGVGWGGVGWGGVGWGGVWWGGVDQANHDTELRWTWATESDNEICLLCQKAPLATGSFKAKHTDACS